MGNSCNCSEDSLSSEKFNEIYFNQREHTTNERNIENLPLQSSPPKYHLTIQETNLIAEKSKKKSASHQVVQNETTGAFFETVKQIQKSTIIRE